MATVYKRTETGTWYAKYFDADGKRVSKNTGVSSKREAERIASGFEADERNERQKASQLPKAFAVMLETVTREAASGDLTLARSEEFVQRLHKLANPDFEELSLKEFWIRWIAEQKRHVGASTATGYNHDFELFNSALGQRTMNAPVGALTTDQINAAIDKAKKAGRGKGKEIRKSSTVNKALASLRRVMEAAVAKGVATHNPAKQSRSLRQEDSIERAPFTVPEIRAMLDHKDTPDEWRGAITLAAHTGLRLGDVLSLSRKHVEGSRLVIMPSKTARQKKVITVPLTPPCLTWIGGRQGDFFPTLKPQATAKSSMQFAAIMKKASVPKQIELPGGFKASRSFHALRHTFASWLAEADIHADVRQKLTGHSSSKIHARYSHHDEALDRAVATLPELWAQK
jgi:integrase